MSLTTRSNGQRITAEFFNSIKTELEDVSGVLQAVTKTSNYTLTSNENVVFVNAASGAVTITLPAILDNDGRRYYVKKIDSSANAVTIDGDGAETIDGSTTISLSKQYDWVGIVVNGSEWSITSKTSDITASSTSTFTNKSIDVDNNTLSNIEVDNFKAGVLDTDISTVSLSDDTLASAKAIKSYVDSNPISAFLSSDVIDEDDMDSDSDTKVPTQQSVKSYVDSNPISAFLSSDVIDEDDMVSDSDTKVPTQQSVKAYVDSQSGSVTASSTTTFTNKTISRSSNTLSNLNITTSDLASGVLDTDINAVSVSHDTIPSALATKDYIDTTRPTVTDYSWTPVLEATTTDPTLGTAGIAIGTAQRVGAWLFGNVKFRFGTSGTNAGSGQYFCRLPSILQAYAVGQTTSFVIGSGYVREDGSTANNDVFMVEADVSNPTRMRFRIYTASTNIIAHNVPFAWAANDYLEFSFQLRIVGWS